MTTMKRLCLTAIPVIIVGVILAGCGTKHAASIPTPGPTASADITAGKHIASEVFGACITQLGGTMPKPAGPDKTYTESQVISALAQKPVLDKLLHVSGIFAAYHCLKAHITSPAQRTGVINCIKTTLLNVTNLTTPAARQGAAQSMFNCSAGVLAQ